MPNIRPFAILAIAALLAGPASAADNLLDVYQRALRNDPTIREAEAQYLALAEVKPQARAVLLPGVTLGSSISNRFADTRGGALAPDGSTIGSRSKFNQ